MIATSVTQQPDASVIAPPPEIFEQVLLQALKHHEAGQLEIAENLYRTILDAQPEHPEANHQLGRLAVQVGQAAGGLPHFATALQAQPENESYWLAYIDALVQVDEMETARKLLALGLQSGLKGEAVDALAELLGRSRDKAQATSKQKATKITLGKAQPTPGDINKLAAHYKHNRFVEAEASARSLTQRFPGHGLGWKLWGVLLQRRGEFGQALRPMEVAVEIWPDDVEARANLSIVYGALGREADATASYGRVLELAPAHADAHNALGNICLEHGRLVDAEGHFRQAIQSRPLFFEAHSNLGNTLRALGRLTEAEACQRRALGIAPEFPQVHSNLALVLAEQGRGKEAEIHFRCAAQNAPNDVVLHSNLLIRLSLSETESVESLFAEHCRFGQRFEAPLRASWREHGNSRDPERCLQIGLVSGDLRNHAIATFIEPVLEQLVGHAQITLHIYSTFAAEDHVSHRLRGMVGHWSMVAYLGEAALAEKIRADGIDILIDLSGHTEKNRLLTFARKPAPLQASWMGYPGTTGLTSMDYYLGDRFLLPEGQFDDQFTEKLVYLPANAPFLPSKGAPPLNDLPALLNGHITFGSFNRPNKLSRSVIALWSQLLLALPTSRMILGGLAGDGSYDTLIGWFSEEGIARERLDFYGRTDMRGYLELHHQVDVCLDAFPYNGATTTLHALWMGVPTLTLAGNTMAGRCGAGILAHVGLTEFVTHDAIGFVRKGLEWTERLPELAILRAGLRERFSQSAMGQPAVIAAGLTHALRTMWRRWCADLPPETFSVSPISIESLQGAKEELVV